MSSFSLETHFISCSKSKCIFIFLYRYNELELLEEDEARLLLELLLELDDRLEELQELLELPLFFQ